MQGMAQSASHCRQAGTSRGGIVGDIAGGLVGGIVGGIVRNLIIWSHPAHAAAAPPSIGTVGTAISNGLLSLRKKLDPTFVSQVGMGGFLTFLVLLLSTTSWILVVGVLLYLRCVATQYGRVCCTG